MRERVTLLSRAPCPKPQDLINGAQQRLDYAAHRLSGGLATNLNAPPTTAFARVAGRFPPRPARAAARSSKSEQLTQLSQRLTRGAERKLHLTRQHARLPELGARLDDALKRQALRAGERLPDLSRRMSEAMTAAALKQKADRLSALDKLRISLNLDRPLDLGFARVNHQGRWIGHGHPDMVATGDALEPTFKGGETLDVTVGGSGKRAASSRREVRPAATKKPATPDQGSLFLRRTIERYTASTTSHSYWRSQSFPSGSRSPSPAF